MWDATTYLKEARDAHGRWVSGAAALGSAIDTLQKSGALNSSEAKEVTAAVERHSDMGRGLPTSADKDPGKTLDYLSATLKHDALTYRHQNPPDKSQAKALEHTASIIDKARANVNAADSPYRLTPDAQPLDGPTGPMRIKGYVKEAVTRLKRGDVVRVSTKNGNVIERTVERAAPNNDKTKTVVRWQTPVDGEKNSTSFEHSVKLSTVAYDGSHIDGNATPSVVPASVPTVKTPEPKVVSKGSDTPKVVDKAKKFDDSIVTNDEARGGIADAEAALDKVLKVSKQSKIVNMKGTDFATARSLPSGDIAVHQDSARATIQSGVIHEYAHLLDRSVLGTENDWFTQHADESGKLYKLFMDTPTVKSIQNDKVEVLKGDAQMKAGLLQGRELFARAFEQYVAQKSNDPALMKNLDSIRNDEYLKFQRWPDDEFAPISAELDKIFADKGMLKGDPAPAPTTPEPEHEDMTDGEDVNDPKSSLYTPPTPAPVKAPDTTPKPDSAALTMFDKPQVKPVGDLKRGNIIEVNTSKGKLTRTLNRSPKKSTNGKLVLEFADDKSADGHKKNLSYELGAKVHVVGQDDSYKVKVVSKANAPTEVQAMPEPKVVKTAAEVAKDAEPKVVQKAIDFDPRKYKVSSFLPGVSTQEDMRIALRLAMATKLKKRGDIFTLPGGVRIVTGGPNNMATGGKSNPSLFRVHGPNGHVDVYGLDNAATTALRFSANSTHPESLGGATAHGDYQEPYLSPEQTKAVSALTGNDKLVGYDPSAQPVIASVGSSGNVKPGTERVVQSDGTLEKMPYGQGYEGAHDVPTDEPKVVKKAMTETTSDVGAPKVKIKVNTVKVKENVLRTKRKMQTVTVGTTGKDRLALGDIVRDGVVKIRTDEFQDNKPWKHKTKQIPIMRKVVAVKHDDEGNVTGYTLSGIDDDVAKQIENSGYYGATYKDTGSKYWHSMYSNSGFANEQDHVASKGDTFKVTRLMDVKDTAGSKVKLHQQPTGEDLRDVLQTALDNGDELDKLNPADRNLPTGHSIGHVQQLLYDLAQGKRAGIGSGTVKSTASYMRDMEASGQMRAIAERSANDTPLVVNRKTGIGYVSGRSMRVPSGFQHAAEDGYQVTLPLTASDDDIDKLYYAMTAAQYNPLGEQRKAWATQYALDHNGELPTIQQFAQTITNEHIPISMASTVRENHQRAIATATAEAIANRIMDQRKAEGTVERDYELPKWDDVRMEPQTFDDIQARVAEEAKPKTIEKIPSIAARTRALAQMFPDDGRAFENQTVASYLLKDMSPENADEFVKFMQTDPSYTSEIADAIDKYKNPDASVPAGFENMLMANYAMNDWNDIGKALNAMATPQSKTITYATHEYTPSFYTAGLADDGLLYHRTEAKPIDHNQLRQDVMHLLTSKGWSLESANNSAWSLIPQDTAASVEDMKNALSFVGGFSPETQSAIGDLLDKADKSSPSETETKAHISEGSANAQMMKILKSLGVTDANEVNDDQSSAAQRTRLGLSNNGSWGFLSQGKKIVIPTGGVPLDDREQLLEYRRAFSNMGDDGKFNGLSTSDMPHISGLSYNVSYDEASQVRQQYEDAHTIAEKRQAVAAFSKLADKLDKSDSTTPVAQAWAKRANRALNEAELARKDAPGNPARRIEYTPQSQSTDIKSISTGDSNKRSIIPRNQRGRLSLVGYTPQEAAERLRELGVVGDLEPQFPADQIFRGPRRAGIVSPLLSDYVRGDAPVPTTRWLQTHGLTADGGVKAFEKILRSGGMMGIQERQNRHIPTQTTSQIGDIGSGIDHVTFNTLGSGGAVGGNAIRVVLKPHNLIRRDVMMSNRDFGPGEDRASKYKRYRDELEAQAGMAVGKTTLFDPAAPAARQAHLDNMDASAGEFGPGSSDEYNVAGQISADDIHTVILGNPALVDQVKEMFAQLKAEGIITRIPAVTTSDNRSIASQGQIEPGSELDGLPVIPDDVQSIIASAGNDTAKSHLTKAYNSLVKPGSSVTQSLMDSWKAIANERGYGPQMEQVIAAALVAKNNKKETVNA
jgi:hypothetical protein